MNLKKLIVDYLNSARLMQIATSRNDQPWVCSVYFAFDKQLRLYWLSKSDRRHSVEIQLNQKIAGSIVLPHAPGDKVRGIQFQGIAKELTGKSAISAGMNVYAKRFGMKEERIAAIISGTDGHACYQMIPSLYVLFDEVNFPEQPRQELAIK